MLLTFWMTNHALIRSFPLYLLVKVMKKKSRHGNLVDRSRNLSIRKPLKTAKKTDTAEHRLPHTLSSKVSPQSKVQPEQVSKICDVFDQSGFMRTPVLSRFRYQSVSAFHLHDT
uniref:Uncharacterized protein n=1 Tax=Micromonas pusilla TaxID=38833 RepID=A0A6U2CMN4_MICPS